MLEKRQPKNALLNMGALDHDPPGPPGSLLEYCLWDCTHAETAYRMTGKAPVVGAEESSHAVWTCLLEEVGEGGALEAPLS